METVQIAFWVPDWVPEMVKDLHVVDDPKTIRNYMRDIFLKGLCAELDIYNETEKRERIEKYLSSL